MCLFCFSLGSHWPPVFLFVDTLNVPHERLHESVTIITDGSPWFNEEKAVNICSVHQNNSLQASSDKHVYLSKSRCCIFNACDLSLSK